MDSNGFDRRQLLNDVEENNRTMLEGWQAAMWTALPGIVQSVNWTEMTVSVQPSIQGKVLNPNGSVSTVNLPVLIHVPIVFPSAGGFTMTFPIAPGDEALVVFAARCIDSWWQLGGVGAPIENRMHDLSDGFAIIGPKSIPNVIPEISTTAVQIRNNAGTSYVEIAADGKIKLVSPSEIGVTGNLRVSGTIVANGDVVANSATTPVFLATHVHSGVVPGGGSSGPPV